MSKPWEKNLNDLHSSSSTPLSPMAPSNYLGPPLSQAPRLPMTPPYSSNMLPTSMYATNTSPYTNNYNSYSSPYNNRFNSSLPTTFNPATFTAIENIVHAFTSFSNMLQSTLGALYSSIRAIYDVIEHFSQLSLTLHHLSFIKFLRFLWRRIFKRSQLDDAWSEVAMTTDVFDDVIIFDYLQNSATNNVTQWPLFIYLLIAIGGPVLVRSMMASNTSGPFSLVAIHSYRSTDPKQLSFRTGDVFENLSDAQQASSGWIRVKNVKNGEMGYVPASYLKNK